jgi:hypothetical protein
LRRTVEREERDAVRVAAQKERLGARRGHGGSYTAAWP